MVLDDAGTYYSLDDADLSGSNPVDLSGNGNNGTTTGATTGATGIKNQCFSFNGTSDEVSTPEGIYDLNATAYTFNCWFKSATSANRNIYSEGEATGGGTYWNLVIRGADSGKIQFVRRDDGGGNSFTQTSTSTGWNDDNWHMITVRYSGTTIEVIIDADTAGPEISGSYTSGGSLNVVERLLGSNIFNVQYWDGELDEMGIWDRALSDSEISDLYNSGAAFNPYDVAPTINVMDFGAEF
jgi:hypothetical protein